MRSLLCLLTAWLLTACTGLADGIRPVTGFQLDRYLGTWYEAARLDHRFERGLSNVSATYTLQTDGSLRVVNRGYDADRKHWKEAVGRAEFIGAPDLGSLQVSFFGPFYGGYHIIALDSDYRWSLVAGPSRDYLWILARDRQLSDKQKAALLKTAAGFGFETDKLIWVSHARKGA